MNIRRHRTFEKNFRRRIGNNIKIRREFEQKLQLFVNGVRDYPINDHALAGKYAGKRAFSVSNDLRVIYEEIDNVVTFLDIGTHNQVY